MVFAKKLNDFAIRRLEGYLAYKWGASSNLPATHPFKSVRPRFGGSQQINLETNNLAVDPADGLKAISKYNPPFVLEGSYATSGLDLQYSTSNSSVLDVSTDGKLVPKSSGTVTVTVSQPGDSHFSAAASKTLIMKVIDQWPQTITFEEIPLEETAVNQALELNTTSSRNLPITFLVVTGQNFTQISGSTATSQWYRVGKKLEPGKMETPPLQQQHQLKEALAKRPVTLSFDPIGTMGINQRFTANAVVKDALTGQPLWETKHLFQFTALQVLLP